MNSNKKRRELLMNHLFVAALLIPTVVWGGVMLIGNEMPEVVKAVDYELEENRNLAKFPTEFSDTYFADIENYYNDRLPFRSVLIDTNSNLQRMLEKPYEDGIRPELIAMLYGKNEENSAQSSAAESTTEEYNDFNGLFGDDTTAYDETTRVQASDASDSITETAIAETEKESIQEDTAAEAVTEETLSEETGGALETQESSLDENTETEMESVQPSEVVSTTAKEETTTVEKTEAPSETQALIVPTDKEGVFPPTPDKNMSGYFPPVVKNNYVILGRGDWLFLYGLNNISYYLDEVSMTEQTMKERTEKYARLDELCRSKGKTFLLMIAPNKDQVYSEYMPDYDVTTEKKCIERFVDYVKANSDVKISYPIKELKYIKPYYPVYFKYDTHWNYVGAFIGEQILLQMLGEKTTNLLNVSMSILPWTSGDLIATGGLAAEDYVSDYAYLLDYKMDVQLLKTTGDIDGVYNEISNAANSKKMAIIGDSFRNHIRDLVFKDFADVTMVNYQILEGGAGDASIMNADIITVVFVERDEIFLDSTIDYLTGLLS